MAKKKDPGLLSEIKISFAVSIITLAGLFLASKSIKTIMSGNKSAGEVIGEENVAGLSTPQNFRFVKLICNTKENVTEIYAWDGVEGATSYRFYVENKDGKLLKTFETTSTTYSYAPSLEIDVYVSVAALKRSQVDGESKVIADSERSNKALISAAALIKECSLREVAYKEPTKTPTPKLTNITEKEETDDEADEVEKEELEKEEPPEKEESDLNVNTENKSVFKKFTESISQFFKSFFTF